MKNQTASSTQYSSQRSIQSHAKCSKLCSRSRMNVNAKVEDWNPGMNLQTQTQSLMPQLYAWCNSQHRAQRMPMQNANVMLKLKSQTYGSRSRLKTQAENPSSILRSKTEVQCSRWRPKAKKQAQGSRSSIKVKAKTQGTSTRFKLKFPS